MPIINIITILCILFSGLMDIFGFDPSSCQSSNHFSAADILVPYNIVIICSNEIIVTVYHFVLCCVDVANQCQLRQK